MIVNSKIKRSAIFLGTIVLLGLILFLPESAHATPLASQIREPAIVNTWKVVLSIVNIFAILALIMMAIVNILRINIEAYNFRRLLPALILGIVLANFSHLISRFMVDFAQILTNFFIQDNSVFHGVIDGNSIVNAFGFKDAQTLAGPYIADGGVVTGIITGSFAVAVFTGFLPIIVIAIIIIFLPSLIALFLALLMYVRLYIIWFLVVMSPVAFFGLIFEPLKGIWSFWWGWFSKWLFLAPIGFFFLRLAVEVGDISANVNPAGSDPAISNIGKWIFGLGMVFLAAYVPFSWGQNVFNGLKGAIMRGAALGYGGMKALRRHEGFMLSNAGSALKKSGIGGKFGSGLGKLMERRGNGLMMNYGAAWQARQGAIDSKQKELALNSSIGKMIATPQQAAIERIKDTQGKIQSIPNEEAWDMNMATDPNDPTKDSNIVSYLKKCNAAGKSLGAIDPSLTKDEQEGAAVYARYFSDAIESSSRPMANQLKEAYKEAGINFAEESSNKFVGNIAGRMRRVGLFAEVVPGEGTPRLTDQPSGGGGDNTSSPSAPAPPPQNRQNTNQNEETAEAMTEAASEMKRAASSVASSANKSSQPTKAQVDARQIGEKVATATSAAMRTAGKEQSKRPINVKANVTLPAGKTPKAFPPAQTQQKALPAPKPPQKALPPARTEQKALPAPRTQPPQNPPENQNPPNSPENK